MANVANNIKRPHLSCIDIYGNQLVISRGKKGKINFTLYHDEVIEGPARKEFEGISLKITSEAGEMFQIVQGLYEIKGDTFVSSTDPIRDGNNFLLVEQEDENSYYMTIGRDLANNLNRPNQTNIELAGRNIVDLYSEFEPEPVRSYVKVNKLTQ